MANDVKWIKMATGLPDNKKLKQIRKLPDGDTIALMWVFLMCLAGSVNEQGLIYITPEVPYTDEMLAEEFRMDVNTIRLGLATFQKYGMLEIINDVICLSSWEKWQNSDGLDKIRDQTRRRVARHREKQRLALECNVTGNVTGNVTVTQCNATEEDIEIDIDKDIYISIVEYLNRKAGTNYRAGTKKTQTCIHARLSEGFTEDDFKTVIDKKCAEWMGTEWEKFLRPETLFGTKFESYLNAKVTTKKPNAVVPGNGSQDDLDKFF